MLTESQLLDAELGRRWLASGFAHELLHDADVSVPDVASFIGVHKAAVYPWLRGESRPRTAHAAALGRLLRALAESRGEVPA